MSAAFLSFAGIVLVAAIAAVATVLAAALGKKGAERTAAATERAAAAAERASLLEPYTQSLTDLRKELDRQRADSKHDRERSIEQGKRITTLEQTTDELTQRLERADYRYREAIGYIRRFRAWVSERMPGVHDAPRIPAALEADLEESP